jgi:hypothetical protein
MEVGPGDYPHSPRSGPPGSPTPSVLSAVPLLGQPWPQAQLIYLWVALQVASTNATMFAHRVADIETVEPAVGNPLHRHRQGLLSVTQHGAMQRRHGNNVETGRLTVGREEFGTLVDQSGLRLTEAQKSALFAVYPLFTSMVARATPPMPREAEPSVIFQPEVK